MKVLITGTAGFIGFHLVNRLVKEGYEIVGLDNINDYYDVNLKYARLKETGILKADITKNQSLITSNKFPNYKFIKLDLLDKNGLNKLFKKQKFDYIIHLAAQAGVRYSLKNPQSYIDSNILGFFNLLEQIKEYKPNNFIFASSSSVYGNNTRVPFSVNDKTDEPVSLYAATKKSNELMAYSYSKLYSISMTGLRFFSVYGPWGRPDMAYYSFSEKILSGKEIPLFNHGRMQRDFTYIDDVTVTLSKLLKKIRIKHRSEKHFRIFNLGKSCPVELKYFIKLLENNLNRKAKIKLLPMQKEEMMRTYSDTKDLDKFINYKPDTSIENGLKEFTEWFLKNKLSHE
jgi:UDP-glucuronate 4-epimerase